MRLFHFVQCFFQLNIYITHIYICIIYIYILYICIIYNYFRSSQELCTRAPEFFATALKA